MDRLQEKLTKNGDWKQNQRQYLMSLQRHVGLSCRSMAERSRAMADRPDLEFTHQAISKWIRGVSQPSEKGREFLSILFKVSPDELALRCGIAAEPLLKPAIPVAVNALGVNGNHRDYCLQLKGETDLSRPFLVHNWAHLFEEGPGVLSRHFKSVRNRLCGYSPDAILPYIRHPRSVVLIETEHKGYDHLESPNKRLWFSYLPDGGLRISLLFLDETQQTLIAANPGEAADCWRRYPRKQVDCIGYLGSRTLFYFELVASAGLPS